jgi:hypothetical protein
MSNLESIVNALVFLVLFWISNTFPLNRKEKIFIGGVMALLILSWLFDALGLIHHPLPTISVDDR